MASFMALLTLMNHTVNYIGPCSNDVLNLSSLYSVAIGSGLSYTKAAHTGYAGSGKSPESANSRLLSGTELQEAAHTGYAGSGSAAARDSCRPGNGHHVATTI